jgi:DNA-binding NtrC family response regulator
MDTLSPELGALASYLEHDASPTILLTPDYRIQAANSAYQRQFGGLTQGHVGRRCFEVSHGYEVPCDQAGEHCPMKQAMATRAPDRVLHIHHTPRGPEHVDVELRPVFATDHRLLGFVERLRTVRTALPRGEAGQLVGRSAAFTSALSCVQRVGGSMLPVLLRGESGTGKEGFARAVHQASVRASGPFVVVDCSGLTESLFESELFGHERGAFTGANQRKLGLVETARGGTLFLDEIGDVPLSMQVKLLRLLETGTFRRVGGTDTLQADFRLVAATHQPLERLVEEGRFRQDLFYRINAFPITLPPLRDRLDDLPVLAETLLQRQGAPVDIDPAAMTALQQYAWPGNVRELRNVLERARLFADEGWIRREHLPPPLNRLGPLTPPEPAYRRAAPTDLTEGGVSCGNTIQPADQPGPRDQETLPATTTPPTRSPAPSGVASSGPRRRVSRRYDAATFAALLAEFPGSRQELAAHLGWSERTLYRRIQAVEATSTKQP